MRHTAPTKGRRTLEHLAFSFQSPMNVLSSFSASRRGREAEVPPLPGPTQEHTRTHPQIKAHTQRNLPLYLATKICFEMPHHTYFFASLTEENSNAPPLPSIFSSPCLGLSALGPPALHERDINRVVYRVLSSKPDTTIGTYNEHVDVDRLTSIEKTKATNR